MKEKGLWDYAGRAGLVLGAVPIIFMLIEQLLLQDGSGQTVGLWATFASIALWAAKLVICILLMRLYMRHYAAQKEGATHRDARRCGTAIALTSALIYSAFVLAWSKFVDPEMFSRAFETATEQYSAFMDSNTLSMMEQMKDKMPVIAFFSNFIWCFLYGTILSAILGSSIGTDDTPFRGDPFNSDNAQ